MNLAVCGGEVLTTACMTLEQGLEVMSGNSLTEPVKQHQIRLHAYIMVLCTLVSFKRL